MSAHCRSVGIRGSSSIGAQAHADAHCRADRTYIGAHSDVAQSMLRQATRLGGRRLDCFDTVLPTLYSDAGFVPVARLAWNDDYAPDGWDYQQFGRFNDGRPDVVFLAYDPDRVGGMYTRGTGEYVDDYEIGIARSQVTGEACRKHEGRKH